MSTAKHTARLMDVGYALGRGDASQFHNPAPEATMDVRIPPIDRQDAKEMAVQNAVAQLRSAAYSLPGTGHPDFAFRDMALGVARMALGAGGYDWERKLLSEVSEAHRCLDAEEEVQCWERVEEIACTLKREAEERCE